MVIKFLTMIGFYYCKFHISKISSGCQFYNKMFVGLRPSVLFILKASVQHLYVTEILYFVTGDKVTMRAHG